MKNPTVGLILGVGILCSVFYTHHKQKKQNRKIPAFRLAALFVCGFLVVVIESARLLGEI